MENEKSILLKNGTEAVVAQYIEQKVDEYKDNPLIEALPHIYSIEEVIDK